MPSLGGAIACVDNANPRLENIEIFGVMANLGAGIAVNDSDPSIINKDPENEGWIFKILLSDISQVDNLMNFHSYKNLLKNE